MLAVESAEITLAVSGTLGLRHYGRLSLANIRSDGADALYWG